MPLQELRQKFFRVLMMDETLKNTIKDILEFRPDELKRSQADFQFTDIVKEIESLHEFVKDLSTNEEFFDYLPDVQRDDLKNKIQRIWDIFSQIKNFKPADLPNPQEIRNSLAEQIKNLYRETFNLIEQLTLFSIKTTGSQATFTNLTQEAKNSLKEANQAKKEILELLAISKETTGQVAVNEYLGIFNKSATKYRRISFAWLGISIIVGLILSVSLLKVSSEIAATIIQLNTFQSVVALVITKLFFLAITIYLMQQCVRNYMANMHQSVLNEHRENSLKVFSAMIKSSSTGETVDQILSYLAKSIFESGETGFFPGKDIAKESPDLVQIFKDIGKPK